MITSGIITLVLNIALTHIGCQAFLPLILKALGIAQGAGLVPGAGTIAKHVGGAAIDAAGNVVGQIIHPTAEQQQHAHDLRVKHQNDIMNRNL